MKAKEYYENNKENITNMFEFAEAYHKAEVSAELDKYKKAYHILMEYFDSISDEEQPKVHKKLNKLGL